MPGLAFQKIFRRLPRPVQVAAVVLIVIGVALAAQRISKLFTQASHGGCSEAINKNNIESKALKYFDNRGGDHYQLDYRYQGCDVTIDGVELLTNGWDQTSASDDKPLWHNFNSLSLVRGAKLVTRPLLTEKDTIYDYMSVNWTGYLDTRKGANKKDICSYASDEIGNGRQAAMQIYTKDRTQLLYTNSSKVDWGEYCTGNVVSKDVYYMTVHFAAEDPVNSQEGTIFAGLHQRTQNGIKPLGDTIISPTKSNNMLWQELDVNGEPDTSKRGLRGNYYITDYAVSNTRPPLIKSQVDLFDQSISWDIDSFGYEFNQSNWPVVIKGGMKIETASEIKLVDASIIDVSGTGYPGGQNNSFYPDGNGKGPGGGVAGPYVDCSHWWAGGSGSYGGSGEPLFGETIGNPPYTKAPTYGEPKRPLDLGSGGAGGYATAKVLFSCRRRSSWGGAGGGRVWLKGFSLNLSANSEVLARGFPGEPTHQDSPQAPEGGGGSGGSIFIEVDQYSNVVGHVPLVSPGDPGQYLAGDLPTAGTVSNGTIVWDANTQNPPDELKFGNNLIAGGGGGGGGGGRIAVLVKPSAPIEPTIDKIEKTTQAGPTPPNTKVDFKIGYAAVRNGGLEGEYVCSNLNKTYKSWFFVSDAAKPGLRFETADLKPTETDCDGKVVWDASPLDPDGDGQANGEIKITFTLTDEACRQPGRKVDNMVTAQVYLPSGVVYSRPASVSVEAKCLLAVLGNVSSAKGDVGVAANRFLQIQSPSVITAGGNIYIAPESSIKPENVIKNYTIDATNLKAAQSAIITRLIKEFAKKCDAAFTGGICKDEGGVLPLFVGLSQSATIIVSRDIEIRDGVAGKLGIIVEGLHKVKVKGSKIEGLAVYAPEATIDFDDSNPRDLNIRGIFIGNAITGLNGHFGEINFDPSLIKQPPPGMGQILRGVIRERIP